MSAKHVLILAVTGAALLGTGFLLGRNGQQPPSAATGPSEPQGRQSDAALVHRLLEEDLEHRLFPFAAVVEASSGKQVIPLDESEPHRLVKSAIESALEKSLKTLSAEDSPVRQLRRINEASRFFEDALHVSINATPGLRCEVPPNRRGEAQRSGYPDLKITHLASDTVFYLDPKLVEQGSWTSTLRTFYFEPKDETLKINDDAVHLLCGIEHDGHDGQWKFIGWKLVDLSSLKVRLKAEFQASNADVYGAENK
jgi:hypothetical protein